MYRDKNGHPCFAVYPLGQFRLECESEKAKRNENAMEVERMDGEVNTITPSPNVHDEANDGADE